jgi:hypothetical protein
MVGQKDEGWWLKRIRDGWIKQKKEWMEVRQTKRWVEVRLKKWLFRLGRRRVNGDHVEEGAGGG